MSNSTSNSVETTIKVESKNTTKRNNILVVIFMQLMHTNQVFYVQLHFSWQYFLEKKEFLNICDNIGDGGTIVGGGIGTYGGIIGSYACMTYRGHREKVKDLVTPLELNHMNYLKIQKKYFPVKLGNSPVKPKYS
nr:hypothetical protein [Tanacetum cinerariifolium]